MSAFIWRNGDCNRISVKRRCMQVGRSISIVFGTALLIAAAVVSNCQAMVRLPDSFSDAMGKTNVFLSISVGTNGDEQAAYSPAALTNALNELSKNVAIQSLSIEIESLCGDYDFPLQWICGLTNLVELAIYGRGSQRVSISIRRNVLPSTIENLQILDIKFSLVKKFPIMTNGEFIKSRKRMKKS